MEAQQRGYQSRRLADDDAISPAGRRARRPMAARDADTPPSFKIGTECARNQSVGGIERAVSVVTCHPSPADVARAPAVSASVSESVVLPDQHGSAAETRGRLAAPRARAGHRAAARARRAGPVLQQPQGGLQEQEDERAGARLPRVPDLLVRLGGGEQRHGERGDRSQLTAYVSAGTSGET